MRSKLSPVGLCAICAIALFAPFAAQAQPGKAVTIVNGTKYAIFSVQARGAGSAGWQPDVLQRTLGVGQMRPVNLPANSSCKVDLLATLDDGHKVLMPGANVCTGKAVPVTDDRH